MIIGVIGSGAISDIYLKNMTEQFDNLTVKAIASKHLENALKKAKQYGIKAYTAEEMLADTEIEMVVILTPVVTHYELIKQALLNGKHVYTEKTITDDLVKAKELFRLADEKNLMIGSAPDTFLGAAWQTARQILDNGMIGEAQSFVLSANRNNDILLSVCTFLREQGCGVLYDYGVYYIACLCAVLGSVKTVIGLCRKPYPVHCNIMPMSPDFGKDMDAPNESQVVAVLQLSNGITGTLNMNADSVMNDQAFFAIYGTKGILYLTNPSEFGGEVKLLMNSLDPGTPNEPKTVISYYNYTENSRGIGPADLADAVKNGMINRTGKESAYHVLEVLTAILKSSKSGGTPVIIESAMERPEPLIREAIPVKNLGHVSFNMKNADAMLHFYRDILGMKEQFTLTLRPVVELYAAQADGETEINDEQKEQFEWFRSVADKPWLTYLKLSNSQFIELFYDLGHSTRTIEDRRAVYGYSKLNYEVDDVLALKEYLLAEGVELKEDYHLTLDGAFEISVLDPDGNEIQFTQYGADARISHTIEPTPHKVNSRVKYTTQVAFDVQDTVNMPAFYGEGLGLKKGMTLYVGDLIPALEASGQAEPEQIAGMKMMADKPWIDYYEVGPHQYIELLYPLGGTPLHEERELQDTYGYQHICIEVSDIHNAWDVVTSNGIKPDTEITRGLDGAYQFWLTDPDGNRMELMEYKEGAMQLL